MLIRGAKLKTKLGGLLALGGLVALVVAATAVPAIASADGDVVTCSFTGLAGALSPAIPVIPTPPAPNSNTTGDYHFAGTGTCAVVDATGDTSDSADNSGQQNVAISSYGDYYNETCGNGWAIGDNRTSEPSGATDGGGIDYKTGAIPTFSDGNPETSGFDGPTTITASGAPHTEDATSVAGNGIYNIRFDGGQGTNNLVIPPSKFTDGDGNTFANGGSGTVSIAPAHADGTPDPMGCTTNPVSYFSVTGGFTIS